jgi:hypothetical protein
VSLYHDSCGAKLSASNVAPIANTSLYRSLAGALQYLTLTRLNLAYAVQQVCLSMHDPREPHLAQIKWILRYVKGTLSLGLHISTDPVNSLTAYSDANWGGCPNSKHSTSGYCVVYCDNVSVVYMMANAVHYQRTKHIKIDIHFVHEKVALGQV